LVEREQTGAAKTSAKCIDQLHEGLVLSRSEKGAVRLGFPAAAAGYWFPDLARMKHDVRILRSFYKTYLAEKEKSNKKELNCLLSTNKK